MGKLIEKIITTENLHWAWKKVKNSFQVGDIWYDEIELSSFEANLYKKLEEIKEEIITGHFVLNLIKPLPFPKGCDENGKPRVRQTFDISIRDQVVWMAVVNVIGNSLDYKMPSWSYGHRLYVPLWKNEREQWEIGWYTHSKGQLYRKWNQSWPLFRRNISLTAKIMCRDKTDKTEIGTNNEVELDDAEYNVYKNNEFLPTQFKSQYLEKDYWKEKSAKELFWGTIDFSKFYPKIKRHVIVENILKYTKGANTDKEFKDLINILMDFHIDSTNWNNIELSKENGIDLDPQKFQGLPTGLFVAGFLANVVLLSVDKKISENLERNRDIAHFRFVDDHVVLAYDFDKLQEWIKIYKRYLEEANTGAEFNFDKIEPKSLANILNSEWINSVTDQELEIEKKKAKKESSLDPLFPAPLMTQTLAKVSAISKSDFEFLSHNEEQQLISDLEHLLLTDFPDHELRKDTRVSFAASVLSRIVPNTKDDYTSVYECQKKIHHKIKAYHKEFEWADKKFITSKLHDLIFNESINTQEYFTNWENEIKLKDNTSKRKEAIDNIKLEKEKEIWLLSLIYDQNRSQKNRVYKLLIKAITENPEKVRVWSRVIDYCEKVGSCHVKETYDKIEELKGQNIHILSVSFLQTLFMNVLSDRIMRSVFAIINKNKTFRQDIEATKFFLKMVFEDHFLKDIFEKENSENKEYYNKTYVFYKFVLGSIIFILKDTEFCITENKKTIEVYNLIDWTNNPEEWILKNSSKDINSWLYWLLSKTHDKSSSQPLDYWEKLQHHIDYSKPSFKPLIQPFPNYNNLPKNNDEFIKFILDSGFDEGWLYEVFKTGQNFLSVEIKNELKGKYPNLYNNIFSENMNLWDFIQWQKDKLVQTYVNKKEIDTFKHFFDPRLSEWTSLEIIRQIIEKTKGDAVDFFMDNPDKKIHPANFIISKNFTEETSEVFSWHEWSKILKETNAINIIKADYQVIDERYITKGLLESEQKAGESAKVHALGIMLLQLITHNTDFPWVWNSTDKSLVMENLYYKKIQNSPISSYTLLILQGCFSSKNREMFSWSKEMDNIKSDISKEVPPIHDVRTLSKYVEMAQSIIVRYQLSMEDNAPRQLLPISLEQLSVKNNPFVDSETNNDK